MTTSLTRIVAAGVALLAAGLLTASVQAQTPKPPDTAVLSRSPLGSVTLSHKAHTAAYNAKCGDCHGVPAAAMKGKPATAFHAPMAKKGTCIDCHQQAIAKGNKKAPAKCADCHKKA